MDVWERAHSVLDNATPATATGVVTDLTGLIIEANGPAVGMGTTCRIVQGDLSIAAQVVGFRKDRILLMPFGELHGIAPGATVLTQGRTSSIVVRRELLGTRHQSTGRAA